MTLALPLAGIRVLDLSRVLAGPYCGMILADMGAEVIKIESLDGDDTRKFPPTYKGIATYFLTVNRGKRSVALDLKAPAAKEAFLRLVDKSDVVLENFRTGVMERLGLGYEVLKARRPSLVYCAISGYGRSGPNVDVPGYDPVAQAESGLMSMIGDADGPAFRVGPSIVDVVTGLYGAQAISAALRHTALTGEGRLIEATLHETGMSLLANFAGAALMTGNTPTRSGNDNQVAQPSGVYRATDGDFMVTVINNSQFRKLCTEVIDQPALTTDERFAENHSRVANRAALRRLLEPAFAGKSRAYWIERLRGAGLPAGAVADVGEALTSPLVKARGSVREVVHTEIGSYPALRTPARFHDTDDVPAVGAPGLGEHTREILELIAGFRPAEISAMIEAGVAKAKD